MGKFAGQAVETEPRPLDNQTLTSVINRRKSHPTLQGLAADLLGTFQHPQVIEMVVPV